MKYFKYLMVWIVSGAMLPLATHAQISSTSCTLVNSPVIDSISYVCSLGTTQVHVTNQGATVLEYSVQSTSPISIVTTPNNTGTFSLGGVTDAVFRVNNGACYTDYAMHFDCNGSPLPVQVLDFTASLYQKNKGLLKWHVVNEKDILNYELQQSNDGINFEFLGTVAATTGAGQKSYDYVDAELFQGYNFYRIKIVGKNDVTYTPVRFIVYSSDQIVWYPNPAEKYVYFEFDNNENAQEMHVDVYNSVSGLQVAKRNYTLRAGHNKVAIDIGELADGPYFIAYTIGDKNKRTGVIKFAKLTK